MKKKIIILSAVMMLFAGVVSASSINGDYKGNPIVKVTSNGKVLETDEVPAQIYDGHTVVPIALLRQLGASVTWDQNSYSVNVTLNNANEKNKNIDTLKNYSKAADHYRKLQVIAASISDFSTSINTAVGTLNAGDMQLSQNQAKNVSELLIKITNISESTYTDLSNSGLDVSDTKNILLGYASSFKYFKDALAAVQNYSVSRNRNDYQAYVDSWQNGFEASKTPAMKSLEKYFEWYNKIQNY